MRVFLLFVGIFVLGFNSAHAGGPIMYKATITNLTQGQVMTPPVVIVHRRPFSLFTLGEEASEGLKRQARDGDPQLLTEELETANGVLGFVVGDGPIMPGQTQEIVFSGSPKARLSVSSMLASTNDAFAARRGVPLKSVKGHKRVVFLRVFDAGAEINDELCAHIPGPPCGNAGVDTDDNEGYVYFHPGLALQGDLDPTHTFANTAARVVIQRIK
jgi:hypothetical protein